MQAGRQGAGGEDSHQELDQDTGQEGAAAVKTGPQGPGRQGHRSISGPQRRRDRSRERATSSETPDPELTPELASELTSELAAELTPLTTELLVEVEGDEVVLTVGGKKRTLDDVDESTFEPAEEAKLEKELVEDEGFTLSEADDADEPEQQVMAAGATADPVKDYLKQIGKVALLNAEQEVELAKRIEAGLFADEKLNDDDSW